MWFTIARGVLTETFYPAVDRANLRKMYVVVCSHDQAFVDGTTTDYHVRSLAAGIPAYEIRTNLPFDGLALHKMFITDSERAVLLARMEIRGGGSSAHGTRVFVLLEPHLDNNGGTNDSWVGEYKGTPSLMARDADTALALLCSRPLIAGACTYAGAESALADILAHGELTHPRAAAMSGNVQLAAEVQLDEHRTFIVAIGFGASADHAAQQARASLQATFEHAARRYVRGWRRGRMRRPVVQSFSSRRACKVFDASVTVLRAHEDKERAGAAIASMAIPWGDAHGDGNAHGYHLVWPRDLVESAGALLAVGRRAAARRTLAYLMSTQERDGVWPQNMWLDGKPELRGVQLDEVALPVLLASMLASHDALAEIDPWPMVLAAAGYIVRNGPMTSEDRWEEEGGYSPYTIASEIAALLAAARFADEARKPSLAQYLRETADEWLAAVDAWTYVRETPLARRYEVDGYYVRLTPISAMGDDRCPRVGTPIRLGNQPSVNANMPYDEMVSPDALALVRFGVRAADDPRIRDTVRVIDGELRVKTARGPAWHRYTCDGYGERVDGSPHLGWGIGRAWPLLTGERAHYEVARGRLDRARGLLRVMAAQANATGLLPEQIWDSADIPAHDLFNGRPTGSAMPLVWAHAEFLKLWRSIADGRVFDVPRETGARYAGGDPKAKRTTWRCAWPTSTLPAGHTLRVEAPDARDVEWRVASSDRCGHVEACDVGVGINHADLPTSELPAGAAVLFRISSGPNAQATGEYRVQVSADRP